MSNSRGEKWRREEKNENEIRKKDNSIVDALEVVGKFAVRSVSSQTKK